MQERYGYDQAAFAFLGKDNTFGAPDRPLEQTDAITRFKERPRLGTQLSCGDFLKGGLTAGLNYYASFKLTDDQLEGFRDILIRGKNKVFALGPEAQLALAKNNTLYGFLEVNYQWEVYARTTTQGALTILATFLMKPLKLSNP